MSSDSRQPPILPPPLPARRLAVVRQKPLPLPNPLFERLDALSARVDGLEARLGTLFKRSMVTIVAADVLVGVVKILTEAL
jgi:hypothetical protein